MGEADRVVRALLTAIATLEDIVESSPNSTMALSTLEGIAAELGEMGPDERRPFVDALDRIAVAEPDRANWPHGLPRMLGLVDRAES